MPELGGTKMSQVLVTRPECLGGYIGPSTPLAVADTRCVSIAKDLGIHGMLLSKTFEPDIGPPDQRFDRSTTGEKSEF